jgi:DNA invertase Pin-like site-specific DNA recombinase
MTRVGLYLRISDDRDGTQTATARQRADCERFAASREWEVVDVFEDVDLSAYKRATKRPEFERMLEAVRTGAVDGVLAWKIDRITRRMRDFDRLDEACDDAEAFIATVSDGIDTRNPASRFIAEILVSQARMESQNQSTRITRKEAERASQGLPSTGGTRMFGYTADRSAVVPEEAALIREAAARVLTGEAVNAICWDWRERGVVGVSGKPFARSNLSRVLRRPTLAAFREHGGRLIPGTWPAILTEDEHRRLVAILDNPARLTRTSSRSYLLAGVAECGICHRLLVGRPRADKQGRYVCNRQPESDACGRILRLCAPVDAMVRDAIFDVLDGVDVREFIRDDSPQGDELTAALSADEASLADLHHDYYVDKALDRAQFFATRDELQARIQRRRQELARVTGRSVLAEFADSGARVRDEWESRGVVWQRALVRALVTRVVLLPAVRGVNRFDPSKVVIEWIV